VGGKGSRGSGEFSHGSEHLDEESGERSVLHGRLVAAILSRVRHGVTQQPSNLEPTP